MWQPRRSNQLVTDAPGIQDWITGQFTQAYANNETINPDWYQFAGKDWSGGGDPMWAQKRANMEQNGDSMSWQQQMMQASGSRPGSYTGSLVRLFQDSSGMRNGESRTPRFDFGFDPTAGFGGGPQNRVGGLGGLGGFSPPQQPMMQGDGDMSWNAGVGGSTVTPPLQPPQTKTQANVYAPGPGQMGNNYRPQNPWG